MPRILVALGLVAALVLAGCSANGFQAVQVPGGGLCQSYVATAAVASPGAQRDSWFDRSIKTCTSLDQWLTAVTTYAASALAGAPGDYLAQRCADPTAKLGGYQLCGLLALSLVTPRPKPTPKSKHKPKKTPKAPPSTAPSAPPSIAPAPSLVPVPSVATVVPVAASSKPAGPPPAITGQAPAPPQSR